MTQETRKAPALFVLAFVLALIGVQLWQGFKGFDVATSPLAAPGALLGWGGVLLLVVLFGWLLAGWWGRDLFGLTGATGLLVRVLGVVALGVAVAGLAGLAGGERAGGDLGAGLATLLGGLLGGTLATLLLLLMAIPGLVLAAAPFFRTAPPPSTPAPLPDAMASLVPPPGVFEGSAKSLESPYPGRRYDEDGNEIPISFEARDVGQVRYADDESGSREEAPIKPPPVEPPAPGDLAAGVRFADEEVEEEPEEDEAPPLRREDLEDGVRFADEDEDEDQEEEEELEEEEEDEDEEELEEDELEEEEEGEEEEDELEDEDEEEYEEEEEEKEEELEEDAEEEEEKLEDEDDEVEVETADEVVTEDEAAPAARTPEEEEEAKARYREKLEGSGFFDDSEPVEKKPEAAPAKPPKKARPRKAPAKKAKAAPKKATPKKASRKKPTKKKAADDEQPSLPLSDPKKEEPAAPPPAPVRKGSPTASDEELIDRAVRVAIERGGASSVLLSRRLGIGYARARALMDVLVKRGVLGNMGPSGSRPVQITLEDWEAGS